MTRPILSAHARPEASFRRARDKQEPLADTVPPLRPLWQDLASGITLFAFLALLAWWH